MIIDKNNISEEDKIAEELQEAKKAYDEKRTKEFKKIARYLNKEKGFINGRCHKGSEHYKSGSRMSKEFDMRVWKWFTVTKNNVHFFISLQTFERDHKTGNSHVLMDRLGIYAYVGEYSPTDARNKMLVTDIELPLMPEDLQRLEAILTKLSECEYFKILHQYEQICKEYNLLRQI